VLTNEQIYPQTDTTENNPPDLATLMKLFVFLWKKRLNASIYISRQMFPRRLYTGCCNEEKCCV